MTRLALCAALPVLLFASLAQATTVVALDDAGLVRNSSVIGVVQVLRTHSESTSKGVFTLAEVQFYQSLKGMQRGDVLTVQTPGGPMGNGMVMRIAGAPQFQVGQMFLGFFHDHGGVFKPTAMSLGVMPIVRDADGIARVVQKIDGLGFLTPDGKSSAARVRVNNEPLADVLARFRELVERNEGPDEPTDPGVQR
ncbi:MAG: hypothetical protein AAFQ82_19755 [Myxococcota bacterium]